MPGVLRVRFNHIIGDEINTGWHNFLAYGSTPPNQNQANALGLQMGTSWNAHLAAFHSPAITQNRCDVIDLSSPSAVVSEISANHVGTRTGGQLPASTALLMLMYVQRRYRGGKPRMYVPAGTDTDLQTPQTWSTTFTSAFKPAWDAMWNEIIASMTWATNPRVVTVSYYSGFEWKEDQHGNWHRLSIPRPVPLVEDVVAGAASTRIASQRRRLH